MRITKKVQETIRIYIPTKEYLDKGRGFQDIAQRTFDAGYSRGAVFPDRIIWPGNPLWPPDEEVCLEYHRPVEQEHEIDDIRALPEHDGNTS